MSILENHKNEWRNIRAEHYRGSLDFSCDFCGTNSYNNLHLYKDEKLEFVICFKCIQKTQGKKDN